MPKFMSSHTLPPGAMKREQVNGLAEAAKNDPVIKPYRSFCNLSEGKIFCVMEAPDKQSLSAWFAKMKVPCDNITAVELEGERGTVNEP
ncbi:MAG TPA: nickel-binding protein [Pirellulales bacterium]